MRAAWIAVALVCLATPAYAVTATPTPTKTATPTRTATPTVSPTPPTEVYVTGFDTCDATRDFAPGGTGASIDTTAKRTGRCQAKLALSSGVAGWFEIPYAIGASGTLCSRLYFKRAAGGSGERTLLGEGNVAAGQYGCVVSLDSDEGAFVLKYKDASYNEIARVSAPAVGTTFALDVCTINQSGPTCAADCRVLCSVQLDGVQAMQSTITSVQPADYLTWDQVWVGAHAAAPGSYTVTADDWGTDYLGHPGPGYVAPLVPAASEVSNQWGRNSCASSASYDCLDEYASGTGVEDGDTTYLDDSTNAHVVLNGVPLVSPTPANQTVRSVSAFSVARAQTNNAPNTMQTRLSVSGVTKDSAGTFDMGAACAPCAYSVIERITPSLDPNNAAWTWGSLALLKLGAKKTSGFTARLTAQMAYASIREPVPAVAQNLQDYNGDEHFGICAFGDSVTNGTGVGVCLLNPSAGRTVEDHGGQCTQEVDCLTCSNAVTARCSTNADCSGGGTCTEFGPCGSSGKYPTALAALIKQSTGKGKTTVLNCGIGGNTASMMEARVGSLLSGVGLPTERHCMINGGVACVPDDPVACGSSKLCASADCAPQYNGARWCATSCDLTIGSKVCSGDHKIDCTVDGDCTGHGTCSDYPGCDYVVAMDGGNDLRIDGDPNCNLGDVTTVPPCPPMTTPAPAVTPLATPTPGSYACPRITCNDASDCQFNPVGGLCSNDSGRACHVDSECPSGTCVHTSGRGYGSRCTAGSCSVSTTIGCGGSATTPPDLQCPAGETCVVGARICSCPCGAIPCASNADCGPTSMASGDGFTAWTQYGTCSGEHCADCGAPAYRYACSGAGILPCYSSADCSFFPFCVGGANHGATCFASSACPGGACTSAGTCTTELPQYAEARKYINPTWFITVMKRIKAAVEAAGRRFIVITYPQAIERPTSFNNAWQNARDDLHVARDLILGGALGRNVVDVHTFMLWADRVVTPKRCTLNYATPCQTNADCPLAINGAQTECAFLFSTLRAKDDPIHFNPLGAAVVADPVADYMNKLHAVCSGDGTTSCGLCSGHCAGGTNQFATCTVASECPASSCALTTSCDSSSTCPGFINGEKCWRSDAVCIVAGQGTCSQETAGLLCTNDLSVPCATNADCVGLGTFTGACRAEGTPSAADGG